MWALGSGASLARSTGSVVGPAAFILSGILVIGNVVSVVVVFVQARSYELEFCVTFRSVLFNFCFELILVVFEKVYFKPVVFDHLFCSAHFLSRLVKDCYCDKSGLVSLQLVNVRKQFVSIKFRKHFAVFDDFLLKN